MTSLPRLPHLFSTALFILVTLELRCIRLHIPRTSPADALHMSHDLGQGPWHSVSTGPSPELLPDILLLP